MIAFTSGKIADWMKKQNPDHPVSQAVLAYAISNILNICSTLIVALAVSLLTNRFTDVFIFLLAFALLRALSGGYHFKTMSGCIVITSFIANVVPFIADIISLQAVLWLNVLNVLLAAIFSPSKIKGQTRIPEKYFPALKVVTVIIVMTNFWFQSSLLALTFALQCVSLIRLERR